MRLAVKQLLAEPLMRELLDTVDVRYVKFNGLVGRIVKLCFPYSNSSANFLVDDDEISSYGGNISSNARYF